MSLDVSKGNPDSGDSRSDCLSAVKTCMLIRNPAAAGPLFSDLDEAPLIVGH